MTTFALPLQEAIFDRLVAAAVGATVYDHVPQLPEGMPDSNFPYVAIGDDTFVRWDTDDRRGAQCTIYLHIWSRAYGFKEAKTIAQAVDDALNRQPGNLSSSGYNFVDCLLEFAQFLRDPDGKHRHGVLRYRVTIEKE